MANIEKLMSQQDTFVATMKKNMKAQSIEKQLKKNPKPF